MSQSFVCEHCLNSFKSKDMRHHHLAKYHGYDPIIYKCDICPKSFRYKDRYIVHLTEAHNITTMRFECSQCTSSFKHAHHLSQHMKLVHDPNKKIYECSECQKTFERRDGFVNHMKLIHAQLYTVHRCDLCKRFYRSKSSLKMHINMDHNENFERSVCPLCPSNFKWPHHLKQHISKVHIQVNPATRYKNLTNRCTLCQVSFGGKYDLLVHMRSQHNLEIDIYKCCQCSAVFNLEEPLKRHLELHEERKGDHRCDQCHPVINPKLYVEPVTETNSSYASAKAFTDEIIDFDRVIMEDPDLKEIIKYKLRHMKTSLSFNDSRFFEVPVETAFDSNSHMRNGAEENENIYTEHFHQTVENKNSCSEDSDKIEENDNLYVPVVQGEDEAHLRLLEDENSMEFISQSTASICKNDSLSLVNKETHSKNPLNEISNQSIMDIHVTEKDSNGKHHIDEVRKNISTEVITQELSVRLLRVDPMSAKQVEEDPMSVKKQRKCKMCSAVFMNMAILRKHQKDTHVKRNSVYKCEICEKCFAGKVRMEKHMDTHKDSALKNSKTEQENRGPKKRVNRQAKMLKSLIKCKQCNMTFTNAIEIARHVKIYHVRGIKVLKTNPMINKGLLKKYKCKQCPMVVVSPIKLAIHTRMNHTKKGLKKPKRKVENTMKKTSNTDDNSRAQNDFEGPPESDVTAGVTTSDPNKVPSEISYECGNCKLFFGSKLALLCHVSGKHMNIKDVKSTKYDVFKSSNVFTCGLCGENFTKKTFLIKHIKSKHPPKKSHRCIVCGLNFERECDLNEHLKIEHRHKCGICKITFVHEDKLMYHMKYKHDVSLKERKCDVCNAVFRLEASLAKHKEESHSRSNSVLRTPQPVPKAIKEVMYKCSHCSALFPAKEAIQRHTRLEHGVGSAHKCGECTAVFNDLRDFVEHLKVEHDYRPSRLGSV